jgi:hypothetical protein
MTSRTPIPSRLHQAAAAPTVTRQRHVSRPAYPPAPSAAVGSATIGFCRVAARADAAEVVMSRTGLGLGTQLGPVDRV